MRHNVARVRRFTRTITREVKTQMPMIELNISLPEARTLAVILAKCVGSGKVGVLSPATLAMDTLHALEGAGINWYGCEEYWLASRQNGNLVFACYMNDEPSPDGKPDPARLYCVDNAAAYQAGNLGWSADAKPV